MCVRDPDTLIRSFEILAVFHSPRVVCHDGAFFEPNKVFETTRNPMPIHPYSHIFTVGFWLTSRCRMFAIGELPQSGASRERMQCISVDVDRADLGTLRHQLGMMIAA